MLIRTSMNGRHCSGWYTENCFEFSIQQTRHTGCKSVSVCMLNEFISCASVRAAELLNEHIASMCELNHCWLNFTLTERILSLCQDLLNFFRTSLHIVHNGPAEVYAFINTKCSSMSRHWTFSASSIHLHVCSNPFNPIYTVSIFNETATVTGVARSSHTAIRLYHLCRMMSDGDDTCAPSTQRKCRILFLNRRKSYLLHL